MTDKEIIIDGVDVSDCNVHYLQYGTDIAMCGHEVQQDDNSYIAVQCCLRPNCYYKQLARKTQECEHLNTENEILNSNLDSRAREFEEALEENHNQNIRWSKAWVKMWRQRNRYNQALEKIEEIIDNDDWGYCPLDEREDCHGNTYLKILDIISKAKGASDNER